MSSQPFVLTNTAYGPMIVSRMDWLGIENGQIGVGVQLLSTGVYDPHEGNVTCGLLTERRIAAGPGVVAIDVGANIGVRTIQWAKHMHGWGEVRAFEPQVPLFYALCGNIVFNNCFTNAKAECVVIGKEYGSILVPVPDYTKSCNFGGLEFRDRGGPGGWYREYIGQNYEDMGQRASPVMKIDGFCLERLDLLKVDVEGMELDVLDGATETVDRLHPIIVAEFAKAGKDKLRTWLEAAGYAVAGFGPNLLAIHESDPVSHMLAVLPTEYRCEG